MRDTHVWGVTTAGNTPGKRFRASRAGPRTVPVALAAAMMATACGGDSGIEKPTPLFSASPVEYPLELWDQDVEGSTMVRVLVNEEGGVDSVMVVESSGHAALDSAAVRGALNMEFEPARKKGEPLRVWARVPVHFLKDEDTPALPPPGEEGWGEAPAAASDGHPDATSESTGSSAG